ncbi:hypothetical protein BT67DRAFT_156046 [Trichocladium antarcticum]|uniref:Uncharacterized protein n=1 Tax=Trichocladium antarcticum TaxID=1450529 RepID=A0AAN6ZBL3_9PEZI|nr:hypothetical protein BT67DRAFT_156046 [Trichocladium antarcticum]
MLFRDAVSKRGVRSRKRLVGNILMNYLDNLNEATRFCLPMILAVLLAAILFVLRAQKCARRRTNISTAV